MGYNSQLYFDMDGVVADFDAAFQNIYGTEFSPANRSDFWRERVKTDEVFRHMPVIEEGLYVARSLEMEGIPICFMTSTGGLPHHIDIAKQKLDWLHAHDLGSHPVAFCMNTIGKGTFGTGNILLDDREKVCQAWKDNGGIAVQFKRDQYQEITKQLIELWKENA